MSGNERDRLRNIKLVVAYDGTDFCGWQRQQRREADTGTGGACFHAGGVHTGGQNRTVQGVIEAALEKLHKEPVTLTGSGRTDTGVHAAAQVANFHTSIGSMDAERFIPALNSLLPHDVRIIEARETRPDFHARFDARLRTYRYYFLISRDAPPWELRYACPLRRPVELNRLNEYARLFRGEMDCSAFALPGDKSKSRSRYIFRAGFFMENNRLVFEISANAFLWKMVRRIVGTLIRCEEKGFDPDYVRGLINSGDWKLTGPAAPPEGLFLWKVEYYRE